MAADRTDRRGEASIQTATGRMMLIALYNALAQLRRTDDTDTLAGRHADLMLMLAERNFPELTQGREG